MESSWTRLDSVLFSANRYFSITEDLLNLYLYPHHGSNLLIENFHALDVLSNELFRAYRLTDRDDRFGNKL